MLTKIVSVLFFVSFPNAAYCCEFTEEYLEELVEHTRETLDEYATCVSSVVEYERWIQLSECKTKSEVEDCKLHIENKMNSREDLKRGKAENSEHCGIFLRGKEEFEAFIRDKKVQKCKT